MSKKRNLVILFIIFNISTYFMLDIVNVWAKIECPKESKDENAPKYTIRGSVGSSYGTTGNCGTSTWCYNSMGTHGVRIALVNKNGELVGHQSPIDYWFYDHNNNPNDNFGFRFANENNVNRIISSTITKKKMLQEERSYDDFKLSSPKEFILWLKPFVRESLSCTIDEKGFYYDLQGNKNATISYTSMNLMYHLSPASFVELLLDYGNSNTFLLEILNYFGYDGNVDELYLQIEPLVQFSIRNKSNDTSIYIGTFADVYYMFHYNGGKTGPQKDVNGFIDQKIWKQWSGNYIGTYNFIGGYFNGDHVKTVYNNPLYPTENIMPNNFKKIEEINNTNDPLIADTTNKAYIYKEIDGKIPTVGVTFISLEVLCDKQAREVIKVSQNTGESYEDIVYADEDSKDKYKTFKNQCFQGGKFKKELCPLADSEFIKNIGEVDKQLNICKPHTCSEILNHTPKVMKSNFDKTAPYKEGDLESEYDKAIAFLLQHSKDYFSDNNDVSKDKLNYMVYKGIYNEPASCSSMPPCDPAQTKAICSDSNSFSLSDSKKCLQEGIAYNNKTEEGYIVENGISGVSNLLVQSSKDAEYGTESNPGYCEEKVSFVFPSDASAKGNVQNSIKAGSLFKWGINNSSLNDKFGTMTVERTCYLSETFKQSIQNKGGVSFTTKWADVKGKSTGKADGVHKNYTDDGSHGRINPQITLHYKEARPTEDKTEVMSIEKDLNVYLRSVEMLAYKNDGSYIDADKNITYYKPDGSLITIIGDAPEDLKDDVEEAIKNGVIASYSYVDGGGQDPRQFTCNNTNGDASCNTLSHFKMKAEYQITYGDNFKWYAKRSDYGKYIPSDDADIYEDLSNNKLSDEYVLLGYGLPTSFVTPTNLQLDKDESYGYSLDSESSGGNLYVTVKNIGTKNTYNSGYHFDNLIKFNLVDDATTESGFREGSFENQIVYSCGFSIYNELFGYEEGICTENCDTSKQPEGMDVVFRTVELVDNEDDITKAFPGRVGNGRELGSNWKKLLATDVYNILRSNIYEQEAPLYHINLTPSIIQKIRKDNKDYRSNSEINSSGLDPYSYMGEIKGDPTYLFKNINYSDICIFDFDGDGAVDAADATIAFTDEYKEICITYGGKEYCGGKNPNPDKLCNGDNPEGLGCLVASIYAIQQTTDRAYCPVGRSGSDYYSYVTSRYLDDLRTNGQLDGSCMIGNAEERLEEYSETQGCRPPNPTK